MKVLIQFTERFGHMLSRTLLTLLYYVLLGPFAILYRLVADPLRIRRPREGMWTPWVASNETLRDARRQD